MVAPRPEVHNEEIAFVLNVNQRTVRRRQYEFAVIGELKTPEDVNKNAAKLTLEHLERVIKWHETRPVALLEAMQLFLQTQCGVGVSIFTVSRQTRKADGSVFRFEAGHDGTLTPEMYHHERHLEVLEQAPGPP
ncbi:hypothetical protein B0J18DRAFT_464041 [Chaetomium sp. MPI-SDFR-AT-0129]|nr:hypothetical protein B0J18DRAFT_464041 [Chaetomium sp. MPI-SDFR-AT-0129]